MINLFKLQQAYQNFYSSKLRSFLAILGVLVGTASVVALLTCGKMATDTALSELKALGTDLISVRMFSTQSEQKSKSVKKIGINAILAMPSQVAGITAVSPLINVFSSHLAYRGKSIEGTVMGVTDATQAIFKMQLEEGRFISFLDHYEHYCVIGSEIAAQMKQSSRKQQVLGQQIFLGKQVYTVIGVLKKNPAMHAVSFFPGDENRTVLIPAKGVSLLSAQAEIDLVILRIAADVTIAEIKQSLQRYIQAHTSGMKIFINNPQQIIDKVEKQSQIFTWLLGLIGGISLFVGGIGIMNIMLVSVTERKREIGIRKAIGAKASDIQVMFLLEAVLLTLFGGSLGVLLGLLCAKVISYFTAWQFAIYFMPIVLGFIVSVSTGLFFGFYPAYRAAKLDPIVALKAD